MAAKGTTAKAVTMDISSQFENNLRRVSEVGVVTLPAIIRESGDRLGTADVTAKAGVAYTAYTIPADSVATQFYIVVDEPFDSGTTADIKTVVGKKVIKTGADLATKGAVVGTLKDTYFGKADGISITLSQDVTKGSVRVVAEYISCSTNNGIYVDSPAVSV